mgnify:FL=1
MKYFIFDVDGTLLNSAEVDQQCLQQMLREFGQEHTLEELRPSFGKPGRQTLADLGFSGEAAERAMDRWEGLSQERIAEVRAFNGVEAMLKALHERGCRCGIVTSRTHYQYGYGFSPLGLDGYFDAVICMEDAPRTKPAPDPLLECLRRMGGTAAEAVYIGDSACDMECAAAAGVKSCLALWGIPEGACIRADIELAAPADALKLI